MSDTHTHAPEGHSGTLPFSEAEWKEFRQSDKGAGGAIVGLMTAIFLIGVVLYTVVAIVVAG